LFVATSPRRPTLLAAAFDHEQPYGRSELAPIRGAVQAPDRGQL
jgi:hypothetical protein